MTTKRGDSGSAGSLGEKCVIIEAPKSDQKSTQNNVKQEKVTKINQKSRNAENEKINKTEKVKKVSKSENAKVRKMIKLKSMKNDKKMIKNRPPLKKAKMSLKWAKSTLCVFRAAWLGTF